MQYTLRLERENIGISISRAPAKRQRNKRQRNIRHIFLPSSKEEKIFTKSCMEYLNGSYRKIL